MKYGDIYNYTFEDIKEFGLEGTSLQLWIKIIKFYLMNQSNWSNILSTELGHGLLMVTFLLSSIVKINPKWLSLLWTHTKSFSS